MREILFRGKRMDNGEWVFGDLIREPWGYCIQVVTGSGNEYSRKKYAITEKTIGQYTGLKDKNGKLIWENDICRRVLLPTKRIKTNFKIAYMPYECCLSAIDLDGSNVTFLRDYINNQYEVEVIGNIFDNTELLKVGE